MFDCQTRKEWLFYLCLTWKSIGEMYWCTGERVLAPGAGTIKRWLRSHDIELIQLVPDNGQRQLVTKDQSTVFTFPQQKGCWILIHSALITRPSVESVFSRFWHSRISLVDQIRNSYYICIRKYLDIEFNSINGHEQLM